MPLVWVAAIELTIDGYGFGHIGSSAEMQCNIFVYCTIEGWLFLHKATHEKIKCWVSINNHPIRSLMMRWVLCLFQVVIDAPHCHLKAFLGGKLPGHRDLSQINMFNMLFCCLSSLLSIHWILP